MATVDVAPRREAVERAAREIEGEFVRGIFWMGSAAFPFVAAMAILAWDASVGLIAALAGSAALLAFLQLQRPQPRALPVVLVIVAVAGAQMPVQSADNRAALMVAVAALGAVGGLFVERRRWLYVGFLAVVWFGQLFWVGGRGLGIFESPGDNRLFVMAVQLAIFVTLGAAMSLIWRTVGGSEKGYRNLFDRAPTSIWEEDYGEVVDVLGRLRKEGVEDLVAHLSTRPELVAEAFGLVKVKDVNEAAVALVGAENREQLLGRLDPRTADRATLDSFVDQLTAIWEGKDRLVVDFAGRTIHGSPIDCVLYWSAPPGRRGPDYTRVLVAISDVSDLVAVQRELARKNALLNSITQSQARFIAAAEPDGLFEGVLVDLLQLTDGEFGFIGEVHRDNGRPYLQTLAISSVAWNEETRRFYEERGPTGMRFANLDSLFGAVLTSGEPVISNDPSIDPRGGGTPDGHPPLRSFLGIPLKHGGELVGMIGLANRPGGYDRALLTAAEPFLAAVSNLIVAVRADRLRKEAESAATRAERTLRLVAENVGDLLSTRAGDGSIKFISGSVERLLGYRPEELVGTDAFALIHPEDVDGVTGAAEGIGPGESTAPTEYRLRHADGSWRLHEATLVNMLADPVLEAWVVNSHDITSRKETEVALQKARDAAEQATATKSRFLANVSHEIRTPMNAILGMTDLVLDTDLNAEQREYLATAKAAADALLTLINDLLDLSKIEAGKLRLETVRFSLRDTVQDAVGTLAVKAAEKGVELLSEIDEALPPVVMGDPGRVRQILFNLVGNAIKFTNAGHVRVAVSARGNDSEGVEVHFAVEDTGIGIPADMQEMIFEAFSQADGSTTRRYGGTGLGLAITADLVGMMGGRIWVESEAGAGSTFRFTLRMAEASQPAESPTAGTGGEELGVMVVADNASARRNLQQVFRDARISTSVVEDLAGALDTFHDLGRLRNPPHAVIVDAGDQTLEVCARLAAASEFRGVPVIAIPVPGERGDAARYRGAGVAAYLTKPVAPGELVEAVHLVTSGVGLAPDTLVTKHLLRERRPRLRVLLADDSATNRMLAVRLLEKRGHAVVAVENGLRAVEAVQEGSFDVVLMDVQMPELDGIEATRYIRRWEDQTHVPIVALTAHAQESDRKRCLEAGMDAYLSKPFRADELYATIEQLTGWARADRADREAPGPGPVIDRREALERVEGMADVLRDMASLFLTEYPALRTEIVAGLDGGNLEKVRTGAHRIKGTVGLFAAHGAFEAAKRLNDVAKTDDLEGAKEAWESLEKQMALLVPELNALAEHGIGAWT